MKTKQISKYYNEKIESFVRCFSVSLQHFVCPEKLRPCQHESGNAETETNSVWLF